MTDAPQIRLVDAANVIGSHHQGQTVTLNLCFTCEAELRERDRFCRRCGANQSERIPSLPTTQTKLFAPADGGHFTSPSATAPLVGAEPYRPVSGSLTKALVAGVSVGAFLRSDTPATRKIILALISIPIWLLIILLSPMDAYATAKTVLRSAEGSPAS